MIKQVVLLFVVLVMGLTLTDADSSGSESVIPDGSASTPQSPPLIIADLSEGTIKFNEVTSDGTIRTIGSLPNTFTMYPDESGEWLIPDPIAFQVASEAPTVAFTARRGNEYRLYIFDLSTGDLHETMAPYWGWLVWSPDMNYIYVSPRPFFVAESVPSEVMQRYLYDVVNDQLFTLTENPTDLPARPQWLPDSSGFAWNLGTGSNVEIAHRHGISQRILNDPPLDLSDVPNMSEISCYLTWSPELERYFYAVGCQGFDTTFMRIYSVDLLGNSDLVIDFEQFFPEPFFSSYVADIISTENGIYIPVQINYYSLDVHWYVFHVRLDGQVELVVDVNFGRITPALAETQISPDGHHIALIGVIEQITGGMEIVNLDTGTVVSQVLQPEAEDRHVCGARWVSNTQIVFEWREYFCYLSDAEVPGESAILDITTGTITPATELGTQSWILPVSDVEAGPLPVSLFPPTANAGPDQTLTDADSSVPSLGE